MDKLDGIPAAQSLTQTYKLPVYPPGLGAKPELVTLKQLVDIVTASEGFVIDGQVGLATLPLLLTNSQTINPGTYVGVGTATAAVGTRLVNANTAGSFANVNPGDDIILGVGAQYSVVDRITNSQVCVFERIAQNYTNVVWTIYKTALTVNDITGAVKGSSLKNDGSLFLNVHNTQAGNLASIQFGDQENSWKIDCENISGTKNLTFRATGISGQPEPTVFVIDIPNGNNYESLRILTTGVVKTLYGFASAKDNTSALTSITVGASPFTYTNDQAFNVMVFVGAGTVSAVSVNGTVVATGLTLTGLITVPLQPGESMIVTYAVAPTMKRKSF